AQPQLVITKSAVLHILRDANDRAPEIRRGQMDSFPDRIAARQKFARECPIYNDDRRRVHLVVTICKHSALRQGSPHSGEMVGSYTIQGPHLPTLADAEKVGSDLRV